MKKLLFFTAQYPYGTSETFIENEISFLSKYSDKVYIIPLNNKGKKRNVPENVEVVNLFKDHIYNRNEVLKKDLGLFSSVLAEEVLSGNLFNKEYKNTISRLLQLFSKSYQLEKWLANKSIDNYVNYSYWFEDWATILSILKSKKIIKSFISRAHGFDLYEERNSLGVIAFRKFQLKNISKLFLISNDGVEYLNQKYPPFSRKYHLSYLGTNDFGESFFSPSDEIQILTISNIVPVKRIHLLVKTLMQVDIKLKWTHFGDGYLLEEVEQKTKLLPSNIKVDFKGRVANREMLSFIKNNHFDLFINISESEGLPVSIMEMASFGIPIFATDAGGTKEIVNNKTGKLYPNNIDTSKLAKDINAFSGSKYSTEEFRCGVKKYWEENFKADTNYIDFINMIKSE